MELLGHYMDSNDALQMVFVFFISIFMNIIYITMAHVFNSNFVQQYDIIELL